MEKCLDQELAIVHRNGGLTSPMGSQYNPLEPDRPGQSVPEVLHSGDGPMHPQCPFFPALLIAIVNSALVCRVDAHEQDINVDQIPNTVRIAASEAVEGIELEEAEVEAILIYEVEGTAGDMEYEIEITADGQVVEIESEADDAADDPCDADDDAGEDDEDEHELEIPISAVPERVKAAARDAVEGIVLEEAEVESVLVYEVEGEANGSEYEIEITAEGQIIGTEEEDD